MAYVRGHFELQIDEKMAVRVSVSSVIIQCPFSNVWLHRRCAARRRLLLARYTEGGRFYSSLHDSDCVRGKIVSHVADPISASIFTSSRHCSAALGSGAAVQHSRLHEDPYGLMTTTASHLRRRPVALSRRNRPFSRCRE